MRRRLSPLWVAFLVALACAPLAQAEGPKHPLVRKITGVAVPPSPIEEPFIDACGLATDSVGNIYIADYYHDKVDVITSKGAFLARIGKEDPIGPTGNPIDGPCDLAVDSKGDLYVNNWHKNVAKFVPSEFPPKSGMTFSTGQAIDSNHPTSVAVDSSDNVYVDDRTFVAEYDPTGAPVTSGSEPVRFGLGSIGNGFGIAIGEAGSATRVYVADAADETVKVYEEFPDPLLPVREIAGAGTPQGAFDLTDADIAVDPSDGHLYVADRLDPGAEHPELMVDELSTAGHYRGRVPYAEPEEGPTNLVNAGPSGVAIGKEGVYITSGNYEHAEVLVFGPAPPIPTQTLTVEKSGAGSGTVARFPSGWLRCGEACVGELDRNASFELKATPDPHNRFVGWTACPKPEGGACVVRMETDLTIGAEFEPTPQQNLAVSRTGAGSGSVVSSPAGIDCGKACEGGFDESSTVTLTASPTAGSGFAGWTGCDAEPGPGQCQVTMGAARAVSADFEPVQKPPPPPPAPPVLRTLTVTQTGVGAATGSVLSEPGGIDCGGSCAHAYVNGSTVTLLARPASGSSLLGWGGCDSASGNRCTVALGADKMVVVAFGPGSPGKLRLRSVATRGASATLKLEVPAPGTLSASGKYLLPSTALPLAAGPVTLRVRLSRAGIAALRRASGGKLDAKVTLGFVPFDGATSLHASKKVTFVREGTRG